MTIVEQDIEPVTSDGEPQESSDEIDTVTGLSSSTLEVFPTPTSRATHAATPAIRPTTTEPTERELVVNAFAICGGQYTGDDRAFREYAVESAIADGRQTVGDIRSLVEEHCGGVFSDLATGTTAREQPITTATIRRARQPTPTPTVLPNPTISPTSNLSGSRFDGPALEKEVHRLINERRDAQGIPALQWDNDLNVIARSHSKDMASRDYFSHTNLRGESPTDRGNKAGYPCIKPLGGGVFSYGLAENIWHGWEYSSYTFGTFGSRYDWMSQSELARQAVSGWMNSPGHRENILTPGYGKTGVGVGFGVANEKRYAVYMTQVFC